MRPGDPPTRDPVDACVMSTEKLRREIAELRARGLADCPECGYPSYKKTVYTLRLKGLPQKPRVDGTVPENPPEPPKHCPRCGREQQVLTIRMKGLRDKSRGDTGVPHDSP